jgi:hypothetical protein
MGMDPLSIKFIRLAHDLGLGCGDPRDIEIVGRCRGGRRKLAFRRPFHKMTFAARMQHKIYWGRAQARRVVAENRPCSVGVCGKRVYHDSFWYPLKAKAMMREVLASPWGQLFKSWETAVSDEQAIRTVGNRARGASHGNACADSIGWHSRHMPEGSARIYCAPHTSCGASQVK